MKNYLLRITPLEPYTFGGENGFSFEEIGYNGTYFMESGRYPEQTTIIGMIRYLMLQSEGKLKASFSYSDEEKREMAAICGADTFSFDPGKVQDFGFIREISPLFLLDQQDGVYIKNPFCNKASGKETDKAFRPMQLTTYANCSMGENFCFPEETDEGYRGKEGYHSGYICISKNKPEKERLKSDSDFFESHMLAGNKKNNEQNEDGFFRREVVIMKDASFGLYLTLDDAAKDLIPQTIVYMGKKKSAFSVESVQVAEDITLKKQAEAFFAEYEIEEPWYYCMSDVLPTGEIKYQNFGIVETKLIRNLKTSYKERGMSRKGQRRYYMVSAGSVFYATLPEALLQDEYKMKRVGYNHVIKIGGK